MSAFDGSLKRLDDVTKRTKMLTSVSAPVLPTKISSSVKFTSIEPESSKPAESPEAFRLPRLANARWNDPRLDGTSVGEATRFAEELSKGPAAHSPQKAPRQRRLEASGALALIKRASLPADFDDEVASIASSMALSPLTSPTLEGRGRIYPRVPRKKASRPYKPPYMTASKSPPQDEPSRTIGAGDANITLVPEGAFAVEDGPAIDNAPADWGGSPQRAGGLQDARAATVAHGPHRAADGLPHASRHGQPVPAAKVWRRLPRGRCRRSAVHPRKGLRPPHGHRP